LNKTAERSVKYTGKVDDLSDKTLVYFIQPASKFFFHALLIDMTFLSVSAEQWPEHQDAKKVAESLKVINDSAEHAVALATDFNSSLTKREEENQHLFQMVKLHCNKLLDTEKTTLCSE